MSLKNLGTADSAGAQSSVEMLTEPFIEGRDVEYQIDSAALVGTVDIESSEDDEATWVQEVTFTPVGDETLIGTVTLKRHMRINVTSYTSGSAPVNLRAGD